MKMYWSMNVDSSEAPIVLDAFEAIMRGECISAIKVAHRDHHFLIQELQE